MLPSATLCRSQQAYHQDRAAAATLENVRIISTKAAVAWGQEALLAEKREIRDARRRALADAAAVERLHLFEDQWFSENPDRGFATP